MGEAVVWAEQPEEDGRAGEAAEPTAEVDQSFAARRLRRWLQGMFGAKPRPDEPDQR